jgi:cytochrome c peroxidase
MSSDIVTKSGSDPRYSPRIGGAPAGLASRRVATVRRAQGFIRAPEPLGRFMRPPLACAVIVFAASLSSVSAGALAQDSAGSIARAALAGEVVHAQQMRRLFPDALAGAQAAPPVIPRMEIDTDPSGAIASVQPNGPTITSGSPFFQNLGSNGRTCFTCHQPQDAWTISAEHAQERFKADPDDPLFRLVDGATCPSADVSTPDAKREAYSLLLAKGLIRIGLPMPASPALQFEIIDIADPYGCNTNPTTGLTSPWTGTVSVYRRPLPTTNLGFLSTIMWDGREPDLFSQAVDATLIHAQAGAAPNLGQQQQIVSFEGCTRADTSAACATVPAESGIFTAQILDDKARRLDEWVQGGPMNLSRQLKDFFIGINDPLGLNPTGAPFTSEVFDLYDDWDNARGHSPTAAARAAIARGEQLFNTVNINITGVAGLNDVLKQPSIAGFCGTCHDTPSVGNHSVKAPLNIGVADAGALSPPVLDITGLPVFTIWCTQGPLAGQIFEVTDPGRALITGQCADIGKVKGPILRGLAARAPYFHNGSAATLRDVVEFYDQRFVIGLTEDQKDDLVAFLSAL